MDYLPVELLATVFASLGYIDLLSVISTSRHWRTVVLNDLQLCQTLFLRRTDQYIPGKPETHLTSWKTIGPRFVDNDEILAAGRDYSASLRAHPVFAALRYQLGDGLETVGFIGDNAGTRFINEVDVFKNFAFIPSVSMVEICIHTDSGYKSMLPMLRISVSNPGGITVEDVIVALANETKRKVDLVSYVCGGVFSQRLYGGQRAALARVADVLPKDRRYFSEFVNLKNDENSARVELQPTPSPAPKA